MDRKGPVVVDQELFDLIAESVRYSRDSDGAFDITVGPLMKAWGFFMGDGKLAPDAELEKIKPRIGYQHIIMDAAARSIRFDVTGAELDLGGIAQGLRGRSRGEDPAGRRRRRTRWSARAAARSTRWARRWARMAGRSTSRTRSIRRRWPARSMLRDRALSISGSSEKFFEAGGVRYSHIMDPAHAEAGPGHPDRRGPDDHRHDRRRPRQRLLRPGRRPDPRQPRQASRRHRSDVLPPRRRGEVDDGQREVAVSVK